MPTRIALLTSSTSMEASSRAYLGTGDLATFESSRFLTDMEGPLEMADVRRFAGASDGKTSSVTSSCCSLAAPPCSSGC